MEIRKVKRPKLEPQALSDLSLDIWGYITTFLTARQLSVFHQVSKKFVKLREEKVKVWRILKCEFYTRNAIQQDDLELTKLIMEADNQDPEQYLVIAIAMGALKCSEYFWNHSKHPLNGFITSLSKIRQYGPGSLNSDVDLRNYFLIDTFYRKVPPIVLSRLKILEQYKFGQMSKYSPEEKEEYLKRCLANGRDLEIADTLLKEGIPIPLERLKQKWTKYNFDDRLLEVKELLARYSYNLDIELVEDDAENFERFKSYYRYEKRNNDNPFLFFFYLFPGLVEDPRTKQFRELLTINPSFDRKLIEFCRLFRTEIAGDSYLIKELATLTHILWEGPIEYDLYLEENQDINPAIIRTIHLLLGHSVPDDYDFKEMVRYFGEHKHSEILKFLWSRGFDEIFKNIITDHKNRGGTKLSNIWSAVYKWRLRIPMEVSEIVKTIFELTWGKHQRNYDVSYLILCTAEAPNLLELMLIEHFKGKALPYLYFHLMVLGGAKPSQKILDKMQGLLGQKDTLATYGIVDYNGSLDSYLRLQNRYVRDEKLRMSLSFWEMRELGKLIELREIDELGNETGSDTELEARCHSV